MKRNLIYLLSAFFSLMLIISACTPEEFELGEPISKSELDYTITQDATDPNMVILESLTPGVTPNWTTPMGRSNRVKDTVKLAFAGEYKFVYGVLSDGGFVQDDTVKLSITTTNLSYVDDPMWNMLTGGVDEEKTWVLDLDADGVSKYFAGPLYFAGLSYGYGNECIDDVDCWSWNPDWKGNSWLMPAGDYGTMTFSLKGNALVHADHKMLGRVENGTYFLDAKGKKLSMTDASPLHDAGRDGQVVNWGDLQIISMTENTMQLAALRDEALSGEGAVWLIYNYISKDYSDNWVPADLPEPEPTLPDGWQEDVSKTVEYVIKWVLSPETPFNWAALDGSFLNNWNSVSDYPDWTGFDETIPPTYAEFALIMNSQDNTIEYIAPDGTTTEGTYTLDEKGVYTFDGVTPNFNICSWVWLSTTAENQWRITKIEKDAGGNVTGMWVGARATDKDEYMVYKLIPNAAGGSPEAPQGTELAFDNSKFVFGDLEGNGNLRLELFNDFGATKADPPIDPATVVFNNRIEVKFTLSGITLNDGAAGTYKTAFQMADVDWSTQFWGDGTAAGEASVTGDGTYTAYSEPGSAYEGALVFVIDIKGIATDIVDLSAVTATIDSIIIY
jgi:hypothetical protein